MTRATSPLALPLASPRTSPSASPRRALSLDTPLFAPIEQRLAEGRPVLSREEMVAMGQKLLGMMTHKSAYVYMQHVMHVTTRVSNGEIMMADNGDSIEISFRRGPGISVSTNQVTERMLRDVARRFNEIVKDWGEGEPIMVEQLISQDEIMRTTNWHDSTIEAMRTASPAVLPQIIKEVARAGLQAAAFLGFHAKSCAALTKDGTVAFADETDCDLSVIARTLDGRTSGWGGTAARDWKRVDPGAAIARAIDMCKRSVGAQAVEPGRRTAILTSDAVAQLCRYLGHEFSAFRTMVFRDSSMGTPFYSAKHPSRIRYGERMFDSRITMSSNPSDPDGGYRPFFWLGFANAPTTWIENGIVKSLAWSAYSAASAGRKTYSDDPHSIRISGGTTTVDEMIAQCESGIYVNQFANVDLLAMRTGLVSGVTTDGCFLVRNGKIDCPVKNFRFLDSPFFAFNKILALGVPRRAAFGFTPPSPSEPGFLEQQWPRLPVIVPPMMVQDFNFSSLSDAV
jgi:predicted Zn-dependent protease